MDDKLAVALIVGVPSVVGMFCILYSIFYEKDEDDIVIQYKPKQKPILSNYDSLVEDTGYYTSEESESSNINYMKEDTLSIFEDS